MLFNNRRCAQVQEKLAEMDMRLAGARLLTWQAAALKDAQKPCASARGVGLHMAWGLDEIHTQIS